ncbi:hypothetical protein [Desulfobacula sp.]|uniref:hypothetical protein n=1 Tax=Desulfobacula sp. TaxID=2593537 RepID=UPI002614C3B2|nr:hypothetical protein [Desulfobacula sp.]
MENKKITIIDETLREGMQYRGLMFSPAQRLKILDFQEKLKVDICQAGYPPAHAFETDTVRTLCHHVQKNEYKIRIAAMGRANIHDAAILLDTHVNDLHFHLHIKKDVTPDQLDNILHGLSKTIDFIRKKHSSASISIAMLDIGRSDDRILDQCVSFLSHHHIDMLSLPDTSGIMAPNQVFEKINRLSSKTGNTNISIHCHNDMGMASANSMMGILAGGSALEASVLGIGERNGIADLYTTVKTLQDQGFDINLNTDDIPTFKAYYELLDSIIYEQTHEHLLTVNTPVFGDAVKTHVAGTHADGDYGMMSEEQFFLNILCGRHMVKKYLELQNISHDEKKLEEITLKIKTQSFTWGRRLTRDEVKTIAASFYM